MNGIYSWQSIYEGLMFLCERDGKTGHRFNQLSGYQEVSPDKLVV